MLKVSENKRYLVKQDGEPFFYLGDTAWALLQRLTREETDRYMEDRASKGFTAPASRINRCCSRARAPLRTTRGPHGRRTARTRRPTVPRTSQ